MLLLQQHPDLWNTTPFWVINEDGSLIRNHWDIFQPQVRELLAAIITSYVKDHTKIVIQ